MRELLFRGKDIRTGEWRYGGICDYDFSISIINPDCMEYPFYNDTFDVRRETVGEYTGQTDMQNNKIFEGDILEAEINPRPRRNADVYGVKTYPKRKTYWVVEWHDHQTESGFMTYGIDRRWHRPLTRSRIINAHAKVVGNIHDNPELMEKGE